MLDLTQLRTFVAVAEEEHLTRGAERIHLSLSAASAHVRAIEDTYGVKLFNRTNRALELTHAGRCLLESARKLLKQAAELESQARLLAGEIAGPLTFGCNADPTLGRTAEIVEALRDNSPGIELTMLRRTSAAARQGLQSGELDVAMLIGEPNDPEVVYHTLRPITYRIAGPMKWADTIASGDWVALAALPWIDVVGNPVYAQMIDQPFLDRGLARNTVYSTDSDVFLRNMISAGVGVSIVREDHAREAQRTGAMAVAMHWEAHEELRLAYSHKRVNDPLIQAFLAAARSVWSEMDVTVVRPAGAPRG